MALSPGQQVEVIGADHVAAALDELAHRAEDISAPAQTLADLGMDAARAAAPVRTGALVASITAAVEPTGATLRTDSDYGPFVEFGTAFMDRQPFMAAGLEAMAARAEPVLGDWLGAQIDDVSR